MQTCLSISGISTVRKGDRPEQTFRPFGSEFYRDLYTLYGRTLSPEAAGTSHFSTFEGLCIDAIEGLGGKAALEGVDLLVVAHYLPNTIAYHSTTSFLLERYGLNAFAFAVSDQDRGASFTALDVARDYFSTGGASKALLLAVEQSTLPMPVEWPQPGEVVDTAVALLVEPTGISMPSIVSTGAAPRTQTGALVARLLDSPGVSSSNVTFLVDGALHAELNQTDCRKPPTDAAVPAFWLGMSDWLKEESSSQPFLLALEESGGRVRGFLAKKSDPRLRN